MKKNKICFFIFYTIVTLIFFGILYKMEYATDTYSVFNFNGQQVYAQFAMSGRFITATVGKFIKTINVSEGAMYIGSYILSIICASFSQYQLYKIVKRDVKSTLLKFLIPTIIIINPFSIELFLFIEKGIMWFGILMCILALENVIKFFEANTQEKEKQIKYIHYKYAIYALILMFIANCSYQGIVRTICCNCSSVYFKIFQNN